MTTRRSRIPKHCLHKPSGQGYIRLNGRVFYTGVWGTFRAEENYNRLLASWLANGRTIPPAWEPEEAYLVEDLIADYWVHAEVYYRKDGKPTSQISLIRYALRPLREIASKMPVEEFGPADLKAYREVLIQRDLARTTINKLVFVVKRLFMWGSEEGRVPGTVAHALRCVRGLRQGRSEAREPMPRTSVSDEAVKAALPHMSRQVAAMVRLQGFTGMRPGEVLQMRWADIDQEGQVWLFRPQSHKTEHHGRERTIPLGPQAQEVLQGFRKLDAKAPIFSPKDVDRESRETRHRARRTPMTPSQKARHERAMRNPKHRLRETYDTASYRRAIHRACKTAKIDSWSPNQLRHSAATRIRREYGIEAARAILGHASAAMTEVYAELDKEQAVRIMGDCG